MSWLLMKMEQLAVWLWRRSASRREHLAQEDEPFLLQLRRSPGVKPWKLVLGQLLSAHPDRQAAREDAGTARQWLYEIGAADYVMTKFRLYLKANGPASITLHDLQVVVVHRGGPLDGSLVINPDAGSHSATMLFVDLDHDRPELVLATFEDGIVTPSKKGGLWGDGHRVDLIPGEAHEFAIHARTKLSLVQWCIRAEVTVGSQVLTYQIRDEQGRDFLTSGLPAQGFKERWDWAWYQPPASFLRVNKNGLPHED